MPLTTKFGILNDILLYFIKNKFDKVFVFMLYI
jgi:hypothetical protein